LRRRRSLTPVASERERIRECGLHTTLFFWNGLTEIVAKEAIEKKPSKRKGVE
jgi:hypothetical protein